MAPSGYRRMSVAFRMIRRVTVGRQHAYLGVEPAQVAVDLRLVVAAARDRETGPGYGHIVVTGHVVHRTVADVPQT